MTPTLSPQAFEEKETYSDQGPQCPYCGRQYEADEGYYYTTDSHEETCDECGKKFEFTGSCSWRWSASQDCEINGEKHDWKTKSETNEHIGKISERGTEVYCECSSCGNTRYIPISQTL